MTEPVDEKTRGEDLDDAPLPEATEETVAGLSDSDIEEIEEAIESAPEEIVYEHISELGPADAAELLGKVGAEDREKIIADHAQDLDPHTFAHLAPDLRKKILESMHPVAVASLISELDSDDALYLIENLDPFFQRDVIRKLSSRIRLTLREGLKFPEKSAGRLMKREFVAIPQFWTVGKTLDYLRAAAEDLPENFLDVFVTTPTYKVVGDIAVSNLVRAKRSEKLESLMREDTHTIPVTMDQEEAAHILRRENLTSAPVVDAGGRMIGVITIDDIVDVVHEEVQEDFMKLAGVSREGDFYRALVSTSAARSRWLFVNLLTAIFASFIISLFDVTIEKAVALAILMPIVASMGGNAGTQTLAIVVRALASRELSGTNSWRIIWKETFVGALNGAGFAVIIGLTAGLWFHSPILGAVIGAAMIINLICAGFFGALIPIVLDRMGSDPAVSSAVFLTTVTDVVGFFAFLGLAAIFLVPNGLN